MPVEPPIETPRSLAEAFAALAGSTADDQLTPIAGGTDVMVRITGEIGEPPTRMLDLWRLDELRGISSDGGAISIGALTTLHRDPPLGAVPRAPPRARRGGRHDRGRPDPEPRHARRQHRQRVAGGRHAARPARPRRGVRRRRGAGRTNHPRRRVLGRATGGPRCAPDELILRIVIPVAGGREARFRKIGTRRAQAISKVVMALAWREDGPDRAWRDVRVALGSVADRPIRAPKAEAALEGRPPAPESADAAAAALAGELTPIDDVRSTADYRRTVAARVLHRLVRDAGGW